MNTNPHRTGDPARSAEPSVGPRTTVSALTGAADHSTLANARAPTVPTAGVPNIEGYEIVEQIGEGGMGWVFLAVDVRLDRQVAIKLMKPAVAADAASCDRFIQEARAAAKVTNDHIVPIWHVGEAADRAPFIAMPLLQGEPLDARLKREPLAPVEFILKVAAEVAKGLAAAHRGGLVHRDIKPANVWLECGFSAEDPGAERCKLLDFGLARQVAGGAGLTISGAIMGTPAYMAPEQARGQVVDHRADLFSLGVMLYRMATGEQPFTGPSTYDVLAAVVTHEPPAARALAPKVPKALSDLIERLMCKDPAGRPQSAAAVVEAVRAITGPGPGSTTIALTGTFPPSPEPTEEPAEVLPPAKAARARLTGLVGAVALVPLVAVVCVAPWFAALPAPWLLVRVGLMAMALAWVVMLVGAIPARAGWRRWVRYGVQFAAGAGIGALALWGDGWALATETADGRDFVLSGVRVGRDTLETGAQYVLFFGLAVCACRWWWSWLRAARAREAGAFRVSGGTVRALALLALLLVVWPNRFAPLGLAALILATAFVAQIARPRALSVGIGERQV